MTFFPSSFSTPLSKLSPHSQSTTASKPRLFTFHHLPLPLHSTSTSNSPSASAPSSLSAVPLHQLSSASRRYPTVVATLLLLLVLVFAHSLLTRVSHGPPSTLFSSSQSLNPSLATATVVDDQVVQSKKEGTLQNIPITSTRTGRFCDGQSIETPCIFDIGHNTGQDTRNYLSDAATPNARVLAIDANPLLMKQSASNFAAEITSGRLRLVTTGLVNTTLSSSSESGTTTTNNTLNFWVNTHNDRFSSFKQQTGCRGPAGVFMSEGDTTFCTSISVQTRSCADLLREFGTPTYMKVDIEGLDDVCVQSLAEITEVERRPRYVSVENVNGRKLDMLIALGYNRFKAVVQNGFDRNQKDERTNGHSGPWGERAKDYVKGVQWADEMEMRERLPLPGTTSKPGEKGRQWYDLHAVRD